MEFVALALETWWVVGCRKDRTMVSAQLSVMLFVVGDLPISPHVRYGSWHKKNRSK